MIICGWPDSGCTCMDRAVCSSSLVDCSAILWSMKITFFVDIDQTISTGYVGQSLAESIAYYRERGVVVPDHIASWPELFQLPAVLVQHEKLPDALAGMNLLARYGDVAYATVRKSDVAGITCGWLWEHGFPSPDQVIICRSIVHKLRELAQRPGGLVLIDDRWRKALDQWPRLVEIDPAAAEILLDRLTLVAFGSNAADLPESPVVSVVPLPDWRSVADVLMALHEVVKKG